MNQLETEPCPGCQVLLPKHAGQTHRYIGASPACWAIFSALLNAGEPPLASAPLNALLGDAYAAQHPGEPSAQAIQSVAIHLLTLYGVLVQGVAPTNALWIRQRALRTKPGAKHGRFQWLTPPSFAGALTISDIVQAPTPLERAQQSEPYVKEVWQRWAAHHATVAAWYATFVVPEKL